MLGFRALAFVGRGASLLQKGARIPAERGEDPTETDADVATYSPGEGGELGDKTNKPISWLLRLNILHSILPILAMLPRASSLRESRDQYLFEGYLSIAA